MVQRRPSAAPAEPPKPKVGEKVGFIQLTHKPAATTRRSRRQCQAGRRARRSRAAPISRAGATFASVRGGTGRRRRTAPGQQRPAPAKTAPRPAKPAAPKFVLPGDAQVITIKPPIVVRELAEQLKQKPFKIIADLMEVGRVRQRQPGD